MITGNNIKGTQLLGDFASGSITGVNQYDVFNIVPTATLRAYTLATPAAITGVTNYTITKQIINDSVFAFSVNSINVPANTDIFFNWSGVSWKQSGSSAQTGIRVSTANQAVNATLPVATTVDVATTLDFTQTTTNITLTIPTPTTTTTHKIITLENLPASTTSLTFTAVGGDTFPLAPSQSTQIVWNGTSWRLLNPAQVAAETGVTTLGSQFTIVSAVDTDVTGLNVTLPSAGKYEFIVSYMVRNSTANTAQRMRILNTANTVLDVTETKVPNANDSSYVEVTRVLQYTGIAGEVIRVQIASNGSATAQLMSDLVGGQTKIAWKKISGFLPVTGQSVDYGSLIANGNASYGTVMYSVTTATNVSPAAPFASNQTILFNGGTASVVQNGNLPVALATGIQTINKTGVYNIKISASLQANGASDSTVLQLVKNNTTPIAASSGFNSSGGNIVSAHNLTYSGTLNAGDTLDVRVGANGVAAHAVYAFSWTTTQLGTSAITLNTRLKLNLRSAGAYTATNASYINLGNYATTLSNTFGSAWNNGTGVFTAPKAMEVRVVLGHNFNGMVGNVNTIISLNILHNGGAGNQNYTKDVSANTSVNTSPGFDITQVFTLAQGDTLQFRAFQNAGGSGTNASSVSQSLSIYEELPNY
jgi:hypothetical protein